MIIFTAQAHKEERFLFPVYPLICLLAAIALVQLKSFILGKWLTISFCSVFVLLSLSRVLAIYTGKLFSRRSLKRSICLFFVFNTSFATPLFFIFILRPRDCILSAVRAGACPLPDQPAACRVQSMNFLGPNLIVYRHSRAANRLPLLPFAPLRSTVELFSFFSGL